MNASILEEVIGTISEQLAIEVNEISIDSLVVDDLHADSLDVVELIVTFEHKFNITATDEEIFELTNVESVYRLICKKLGIDDGPIGGSDGQISW
jgi:acyl carrier protein